MGIFSEATEAKFKHLASIYPRKRSALIPMLLLAQHEHGHINSEAVNHIGRYLDLDPSEVDSILSFYTLLHRQPVGKYHIMICTNLACMLNGSDEIEACVKRKLGVELKEITPDGMFSAIEFECLGSCTTAPVMQINGEFYENLNAEKVERIIEDLRKR
jgi:NADH-quinone oxidoreductase subunit E